MDWNKIQQSWPIWKPTIGKAWEKLTKEDLSTLSGNREQLADKISHRYKISEEEAERQITSWLSSQ